MLIKSQIPINLSYSKADRRELLLSKIGIIILFVIAAPLNWLALILIIDSVSFLSVKKLVIFSGFKVLNTMYARLLEFGAHRIILPFIIIFSLPFIFSILILLSRLLQKMFKRSFVNIEHLNDEMKYKRSELYKALSEASKNKYIEAPKLLIFNSNIALCYSDKNIFIKRAKIIISNKALDILELGELKVAVFHELYHIIKGINRIEISKIISRLGMFPNYYLSLLLDLNKEEYEADKFAIQELGDNYKEHLNKALYKIDIYNKVALTMSKKKKSASDEYVVFAGFGKELKDLGNYLYGRKLIGYSHASIVNRTDKLKNI